MEKTFKTVAYLHIKNKKILLTKSKKKNAFYFAGGKLEQNESEKDALVREIKEELTVELQPESLKKYGVFEAQAYGEPSGINVQIVCFTGKHTGQMRANSEIGDLKFFTYKQYCNMPETAPAVLLALKDLHDKQLIA